MRLEKHGVNVAFQVVDWHERLAEFGGQDLAVRYSHQERTDEAGPLGHADSIDVSKIEARLEKRLAHDGNDLPQVLARGEFGNNAAVLAVNVELRGDDARQDLAPIHDDCRGGFVTRRLDSKNACWHSPFLAWGNVHVSTDVEIVLMTGRVGSWPISFG